MIYPLTKWIGFGYKFWQRTWYSLHHKGVDFIVSTGTPVYAIMDGQILTMYGYQGGKQIWHTSDDGDWRARYMHLSSTRVPSGDHVKEGDLIGYSGNTGVFTTGPHLHFDLQFMGKWVDPLKYLTSDIIQEINMTKDELIKELDSRYSKRDQRLNFDPIDGSTWICNNNKRYKMGTQEDDWKILANMHAGEVISDTERTYPVTNKRTDVL